MSGIYKDGRKYTPKPKAQKRLTVEESAMQQNITLLLQKKNLIKDNIADEFLDAKTRHAKVYERAFELASLPPNEILVRLAETEIHLETTLFLYEETFKQKQFLEKAYLIAINKRLTHANSKALGKAEANPFYGLLKDTARQVIKEMEKNDFKLFCRKMRAKFSGQNLSANTLRNYYLEITGLKSTK